MTIATTVRDLTSGASSIWWNSCRLLIMTSWVACLAAVFLWRLRPECRAFSLTGASPFYSRFCERRLVVFGHPMIRRDLFQFGSVVRFAQPGLQKSQLGARVQR